MSNELESLWEAMKGTRYQRVIGELRQSICQAEDLDSALVAALNRVVLAVHAEAGTFWFYDKFGDGRIRPKAIYGGKDLGDFSLAPGEGIAGQVVAAGRSAIIQDCQSDPRWVRSADDATGFCTKTMICVPLIWKLHVFGCIQILNRTDGGTFDETDLVFVENLGQHTANLFEQQQLLVGYEQGVGSRGSTFPTGGTEPSFSAIFAQQDFEGVENALRRTECFARMDEESRREALQHCREIWTLLDKRRGQPDRPKRKLFGW